MYSPKDLNEEVFLTVGQRVERGEVVSRGWLVAAILGKHKIKRPRRGDPDEFSICCRQLAVSAAVDNALARMKLADDSGVSELDEQGVFGMPRLPGFHHLRRAYPIKRDGVIMLVPIEQMTAEERDLKAKTYLKASRSLAEHAEELMRYRVVSLAA